MSTRWTAFLYGHLPAAGLRSSANTLTRWRGHRGSVSSMSSPITVAPWAAGNFNGSDGVQTLPSCWSRMDKVTPRGFEPFAWWTLWWSGPTKTHSFTAGRSPPTVTASCASGKPIFPGSHSLPASSTTACLCRPLLQDTSPARTSTLAPRTPSTSLMNARPSIGGKPVVRSPPFYGKSRNPSHRLGITYLTRHRNPEVPAQSACLVHGSPRSICPLPKATNRDRAPLAVQKPHSRGPSGAGPDPAPGC